MTDENFKVKIKYFAEFSNVHELLIKISFHSIKVVRAASPLLLRMIILGAFFIYSTVSESCNLWIYTYFQYVLDILPTSTWTFCQLPLYFNSLQTIVVYPTPHIVTCTLRIWLREIGFALAYGALMLKTWR